MKILNLFKFIFTASFVFAMASSFAQTSNPDYKFSLGEVKYFIQETKGTSKAQNDTTFYNLYRVSKKQRIAKEIKSVVSKKTRDTLVKGSYQVYYNNISFLKTNNKNTVTLRAYTQNNNGILELETKVATSGDKNVEPTREAEPISPPGIARRPTVAEINAILEKVDVLPEYPGGINALRQFLAKHIEIPDEAVETGVNGTVIASFVVERDGFITDIKIDKKLGYGCDEEVIRVLKRTPKWTPGSYKGKPVRTRFRLPVLFNTGD